MSQCDLKGIVGLQRCRCCPLLVTVFTARGSEGSIVIIIAAKFFFHEPLHLV